MSTPTAAHIPNFRKVRKAVSTAAEEVSRRRVLAFAETEHKAFIKRIEAQDFVSFDIAPLNPTYRARKVAQGLDPRTMIRTRRMIDAVKVFTRRNDDGSTTFHVGFHARAMAVDAKGHRVPFLLRRLAITQEKGSVRANIPARPHWRPHYDDMHKRAPAVREAIKAAVAAEARKRAPGVL